MSNWRPLLLVALVTAAGAAGTLAVGSIMGMPGGDLKHLGILLIPGIVATVISTAAARPLLARASVRARLVAIAAVATLISLANLAVLSRLMFVSDHDAAQIAVLLLYSMGAGLGAALTLARKSDAAVARLVGTARALADGDLGARVGTLDAGPELDLLADTLDEMAERLSHSIDGERAVEAMRRDLFRAVSHDLRTPLAGLRAMVEAIDDGVVGDLPSLRNYAAEMRVAVEVLGRLVDDLFELVQLDAGAIEADAARVRLKDVMQSAVAACRAQAAEKGLQVLTQMDGAGQELCSPRMMRVIQNLLQNAIRHTPSHGLVRLEATRNAEGLQIAVADTGPGIPAESLGRVFEPFWRADSARSTEGSGLGLALAKRIVESQGGRIWAESEPHRGARFAVLLPHGE